MPDTIRREPNGAIPIDPTFIGVSTGRGEKPVQLLRVRIDPVKLEHHCCGRHSATFAAEGAVFWGTAEWLIGPLVIPLPEQWYRQFDPMKKIASTAWRKLAFPNPVETNKKCCCDQGKRQDEEEPAP